MTKVTFKATLKQFQMIDLLDFFETLQIKYSRKKLSPIEKVEQKMIKLALRDLRKATKKSIRKN